MKDYPKHREDWLHLDHYAKLSTRQNPHGLVCVLCEKTHKARSCPNRRAKEPEKPKTPKYETMYSAHLDEDFDGY